VKYQHSQSKCQNWQSKYQHWQFDIIDPELFWTLYVVSFVVGLLDGVFNVLLPFWAKIEDIY